MTTDHNERNAASRRQLGTFVELARSASSSSPTRSTTSAVLAHLAFWDRLVLLRWERALASGQDKPPPLDSAMTDFINDAAFPQWRRIAFDDAVNDALDTAAELDQLIEGLDTRVVKELIDGGRERLVDRSIHRLEHLEKPDH